MDENYVGSAIKELLHLREDSRWSASKKDQIDHLLMELQFLDLYTQCLDKWNEALSRRQNRHLGNPKSLQIEATLGGAATKSFYFTGMTALQTQDFNDWESLASDLLKTIQLSKPRIKKDCLEILHCSLRYNFSSVELQKFYNCLRETLNNVRLEADPISDLKIQIQGIKVRLQLFKPIFESNSSMDNINKDVKKLKISIRTWILDAACLSLLYWIAKQIQEETESRKQTLLCTPRMFLDDLKCLWSLLQNRLLMYEGVRMFADFVQELLHVYTILVDDIENIRKGLIFLTMFLVDPPLKSIELQSISKEVEFLICSTMIEEQKASDIVESFQQKMNGVVREVRELYARVYHDSSSFDFPNTNVLGFVDSLLEILKDGSRNNEVQVIHEELKSLRPFLQTIMELQKEDVKMKDLWTQIVNAVYRVKVGIQLLLYVNNPVWSDLKHLSDVTDEIKLLRAKIQDEEIHNIKVPVVDEDYSSPSQATAPKIDEVFVGFKEELETIIPKLINRDSVAREIISIFGMPGLGKTTLAKKIYNHPEVQQHFIKRAWCCVSQTYQIKKLLLEILSDIVPNDDFSSMAEEDLEWLLKQKLCGERYLIVMDDIWSVSAWNELQFSFPDNMNGSIIMFTSRIKDVALEAKQNCILHPLRQLSLDESVELLEKKLFREEGFPFHLKEVGEKIANDCKGLPLAIVVIAGILSNKIYNVEWWKGIAESIDSKAKDGCMHILELSYKHLPESLRPCFLYFGAFQEDRVIRVRKLIQLWISEGFIQKSEEKNSEDIAEDYLMDLVARSLVVAAQRTSKGGIKTCRIHDLLLNFCLEKGKQENALQVGTGIGPSSNSTSIVLKNYRVCIRTGEDGFFSTNPSGPCVHSLLFLPDYSFYLNEWEFFYIGNFILLQVLDLEEVEFDGFFPEEVVLLVLLRYLAIWCPSGALSVPSSIADLKDLETFRVKRYSGYGNEASLPNAIWKMKRLRHIDVGAFTISIPNDCEPQDSFVFDNIQTFSAPSLCCGDAADKLLRRILKVRKLRCQFDDSSKECNQYFPALECLEQLESLNVIYTGKKLLNSCAFSFPLNLKKLTLSNFKLPWGEISRIGELKELEVLKLLEDAFIGETWKVEDDEFPKLKFLKISNMNLVEWDFVDCPFPCLEQLIMEDCDKLKEIEGIFLERMSNLKRLEVRWCNPELEDSARQIKEEFEYVEVITL